MAARIPRAAPRFKQTAAVANAERLAYDQAERRREQKRFYSGTKWRRLRAAILAESPLCARCPPESPRAAKDVHHRIPRDVARDLELEPTNLEPLCRDCHKRTRDEDAAHRRKY